jgi:transcriptional regulator with XRE-family HTH domain
MTNTIASRIRQARIDKGISQAKLAELTEVSPTSAAAWEASAVPRDAMIEKIAAALDVTADYLRDGEPEQTVLSIMQQAKAKIGKALKVSDSRFTLELRFNE